VEGRSRPHVLRGQAFGRPFTSACMRVRCHARTVDLEVWQAWAGARSQCRFAR
jgi:hypothetical protein